MDDQVARRALDRALDEKGDLVLLYQPIHSATDGGIYAAEALLRQRRESGEIREAHIITDAAERAPIEDLDRLSAYLLDRASDAAARWQKETSTAVRLNVNVSAREFMEPGIAKRLAARVHDCAVDPAVVNLEITETSYISDPEGTVAALKDIRQAGFELWLDDFGTGHSSLTHLQRFPVNGIKLPAEFVSGIVDDKKSREIDRALIELAHDFGMKVIAEGVETEDQLSILRDFDCDYIQGFLFSRPMQLADFEKLLLEKQHQT